VVDETAIFFLSQTSPMQLIRMHDKPPFNHDFNGGLGFMGRRLWAGFTSWVMIKRSCIEPARTFILGLGSSGGAESCGFKFPEA